ncbi:hypothetical protein B0H19DRAFT_1267203 [Mycena capillaripes]|nr:hypothetical protein B0H19DRAFT_1267203 [Mycena capillaripes]
MSLTRRSPCLLRRIVHDAYSCRRALSSSPWRANELDWAHKKEKARIDSAVNWVNRVLQPPRPGAPQPTTIWVHNTPLDAPLNELMRLVLFGPLFRITDIVSKGRVRYISLTFYENATAVAFFREMSENEVLLRGSRLKFEWGRGPIRGEVPGRPIGTRAIFIHRGLGTTEQLYDRLTPYGAIERIFHAPLGGVFVDFLTVKSAVAAVESLRRDGVLVGFADDHCYAEGRLRASAIQNHVRQVILGDVPLGITLATLCDQIRGGALERIVHVPDRRVAFVHFLNPSAAATFSRYALYHGITLGGQRLSVQMKPDKNPAWARLVPHLAAALKFGASRCLSVTNAPNIPESALRRDFERFGLVERVKRLPPPDNELTLVSFADIEHAIAASRLIGRQAGYEGARVAFAVDPCGGPLPGARERAKTLQAHIAGFLSGRAGDAGTTTNSIQWNDNDLRKR